MKSVKQEVKKINSKMPVGFKKPMCKIKTKTNINK